MRAEMQRMPIYARMMHATISAMKALKRQAASVSARRAALCLRGALCCQRYYARCCRVDVIEMRAC